MSAAGALAAVFILAVVGGQAIVLTRRSEALGRRGMAGRAPLTDSGAVAMPGAAVRAPRTVPAPATGRRDPLNLVVDILRRRRWARRSLSVASFAIVGIALYVMGYPFYTNLLQTRIQQRLDRQLASPELRQAYMDGKVQEGDSLTRIKIPSLNVDVVVVQGTTATALRAGAGHYASTPLPCEVGNVGIAGHRTTYGRPFANVDLLKPGDVIVLETPVGSCTYSVSTKPFATTPTDGSVLKNSDDAQLTLTTCHPKGSAAKRLIIKATMVSAETGPS